MKPPTTADPQQQESRAPMTDRTHYSLRPRTWAGGVTAALVLLVGCANGADTVGAPAPGASPAATTSPSPSASSPASPTAGPSTASPTPEPGTLEPPAAADVTVDIAIAGGKVTTGVQNVMVEQGQSVMIRGVSDVADSLHVHGYDQSLDLKPREPAELTLTADVTGVFEIETHETALLVAKLTVS